MKHKGDELANERAREALYRREVEARNERSISISAVASAAWTRSGAASLPPRPDGHVVGRVACATPGGATSPAGDFYIGSTYHQGDGYVVYNWKTPIAAVFYTRAQHDACGAIVGTRTFVHDASEIADFQDEWRDGAHDGRLFARRELQVPAAPKTVHVPTKEVGVAASLPPEGVPGPALEHSSEDSVVLSNQPAPTTEPAIPDVDGRAHDLLKRQLRRPRVGAIGSVLSTLQPEQYRLVTTHGHDDVIIEGHPGTGKTIIAAHRAAYLASSEYNSTQLEDEFISHVLLIGPTDDYVDHVAPSITRLTDGTGRITATSLRWLLARAAGVTEVPEGQAITRIEDADDQLWSLALDAVLALKSRGSLPPSRSTALRVAYELLRHNGFADKPVTRDSAWQRYLSSLPPFAQARTQRRHAPLLAALGWHIHKPADLMDVDHVIVDEAQDVMPIEWVLIDAINGEERWTIMGDMNQRRSDAALGSWNLVAKAIGILGDDGKAEVTRIRRGYRSTLQIMRFANQLLPKQDRDLESIQDDGFEVTVARVREATLHESGLEHALQLLSHHEDGSVAIIGLERPATETVMRKEGWRRDGSSPHAWERRGRTIHVVSPDQARGLEWDGVVVLEPARFPRNFQRHGLLFTSLTRANRELHVVYSQALPEALRGRT